jgi:hypothetical protein
LVTDTAINFAIHVRRILDNNAIRTKFTLDEPFRHWCEHRLPKVADLRDALNRIVHATEFEVGFERLPDKAANITGGAIGAIYLRTRTDQREEPSSMCSRWPPASFTKSCPFCGRRAVPQHRRQFIDVRAAAGLRPNKGMRPDPPAALEW